MNDNNVIEAIQLYWRERGYKVKVEVQECTHEVPGRLPYKYHAIRSNLRNGLPRGYRGDKVVRRGAAE